MMKKLMQGPTQEKPPEPATELQELRQRISELEARQRKPKPAKKRRRVKASSLKG
jgi:hypothetical protein